MFTDEDIKKLIETQQSIFATKEDLYIFKDEILVEFSKVQTLIDTYTQKQLQY